MLIEHLEDRRVLASWSGTLSADTTWDNDEVHEITNDLTVASGVTLTINPGAIVKFHHANADLFIAGTLDARGTITEQIIFTSLRDDVGGDTNGDGTASTPDRGQWARLQVNGSATIAHTEIRYGGYFYGTMVLVNQGTLELTDSIIRDSASDGVRAVGSDPVLARNVYQNNAGAAISMDLNSNPDVSGVTVADNGINGLQVDAGTLQRDLTWNDPDIVYRLDHDITVPLGVNLTVEPGQIVKPSNANLNLIVDGSLNIVGSESDPVVFTSFADDTRGGDTNGDADSTAPSPGNWARILLRDSSAGNTIDHAEFHYGGYFIGSMVHAVDTDLTVTNSLLTNSASDGIRLDGTDAILIDNAFQNNADAAVSMNLNSNPEISGVTLSGNGINGLQVDAGTLQKDLTWNDPDIVYRLDHDITVPLGVSLTIEPGQIVKPSNANLNLIVDGSLSIVGSESDPVVFTSFADDTRGGDTNGDADSTTPSPGNWARILLRDSSAGNTIDHAEFHYGGYFIGSMVHAIDTDLIVTNTLVANSASDGIRLDGTDAILTDNAFQNNADAAVSMNLNSNPAISGVTLSGNGINGLQVDSGTLMKDLVWDDPNIVYRLNDDITVPAGLSLTIDAGQIIKPAHSNVELLVDGTLQVNGTVTSPVVFTSIADDTRGGDTNGNGTATAPLPGNWSRILMRDSSLGNSFDHAEFHYGGYFTGSMLHAVDTDLTVTNSLLASSDSDGIRLDGTDAILTDNAFQNNADAAVSMNLNSNPAIGGVTLSGNGINGLQVDSGTLQKDLTWNDPDIVYRLNDDIIVPAGLSLTIDAGQIVKPAHSNVELLVDGTLQVNGTVTSPVVFTSIADDTRGGDTNGNGAATAPTPGNWSRILMRDSSAGNTIDHAEFHYGGYFTGSMVHAVDTDLTVTNSLLAGSDSDGIRLDGTDAILTDNAFQDNANAAVSMNLNSNPEIVGVTLSGNGINGLQVDSGTLTKDLIWNDPDIVYRPNDDIIVPVGLNLTIDAGQIVKPAHSNVELIVNGAFEVNGTVANPVVFTSIRDDTTGGDTNNDADASVPSAGDWARILLNPDSINSVIGHAELRYGGYFFGGTVFVNNASAVINSTIIQDSAGDAILGQNGATIEVTNSVLVGNGDAGIEAFSGSDIHATNNTIVDNRRGVASGDSSEAYLTNNLITFNHNVGVISVSGGAVSMEFNNVFQPESANFTDVVDPTGSDGNLSADPKYFSRSNRQFNLRSGSPAIDSGTSVNVPVLDRLDQSRFDDPNVINSGDGLQPYVDMGALERQTVSTSQVDLKTASVIGVDTGTQDDVVTVHWTVENIGREPAVGAWFDGVFLSADTIWTPDDIFLGDFQHVGNLGPQSSYSAGGEVKLPGVLPGDYHFIVRSDVRNEVFEALQEPNNAQASPIISLDLPPLSLGNPAQGTLVGADDFKLYRVAVPDGADLRVEVTGPSTVTHELYLSHEELPSRQHFEQRGIRPDTADQVLSVANTRAGDYIVLVYGADVPAFGETFTLTATLEGFGITSVSPFQGANLGNVTLTVNGSQFNGNTEIQLIDSSGAVFDASTVYFSDSGRMAGTFDLDSVAVGLADVRVINPGNVVTELPDAFNIIEGVPGKLEAFARVPSRVRGGRSFQGSIEYRNAGDTDLLIPFLTVDTTGVDLLDLNEDLANASTSLQLLAANPGAPAGILPPGAVGKIPVFGQSTGAGNDTITVSAGVFADSAIPWDSLKDQLTPAGADPVEFNAIYDQIRSQIGDQWPDYVQAISRDATLLPPSLGSPQILQDVFSIEILRARAALGTSVSGRLFLNDVSDTLVDARLTLIDQQQGVAHNATSLTDGSFVFTDVTAGTYALVLDGFVPQNPMEVQVDQSDIDLGDTIVVHGAEVSGSVLLDQFGIPARNVIVSAVSDEGFFVTETDLNGRYRLKGMPAGTYELSTQSVSFSSVVLPGLTVPDAGVVRNVNLAVESSSVIRGTVLDPGNVPIEGARVFATTRGINGQSGTTDANGNFVVQGLPSGRYNLVVTADGFAQSVISQIELSSGGVLSGVTANMIIGGDIAGTVSSALNGETIPYALIVLRDGDTVVGAAQTDSDGAFDLADVAPGTYTALISADGFLNLEQQVTINASQTTPFSPSLDPAGTVVGTLRDAGGSPIKGLVISAEGQTQAVGGFAVSNEDGSYIIRNLPWGEYDVRVGARAGIGLAYSTVTLAGGSSEQTVDFDLATAGYISGVVLGNTGQPMTGATVRLLQDGLKIHETYTGQDGSYSFVVLEAGQYDLGAGAADLVYPIVTDLDILGGVKPVVNFQPGMETFDGILTDQATGDPIADATVLLSQTGLGYAISSAPNQVTASDGSFQFNGLTPGDYDIQFLVPGKATILETVTVSQPAPTAAPLAAPVGFSAQPGFSLTGTLRAEFSGLPIPGGQVDVYRRSDGKSVGTVGTDASGKYLLGGLPDGMYDLVASGAGRQKASLQSVAVSGGDTFVDVPLPASTTTVSGTVNSAGLGPPDLVNVKITDIATSRVTELIKVDPDGKFNTGTLPPGDYTARVVGDGLLSPPVPMNITPGNNSGFILDTRSVAGSGQDEPLIIPPDGPAPGEPGWYDTTVDNTTLDQLMQDLINQLIPAPSKGCEALHASAVSLLHKSIEYVGNAQAARDAQRATITVDGIDTGLDADTAIIAANALIVAGDIASLITSVKGAIDAVAKLDDNFEAALKGREAAVEAAEFVKFLGTKKADLFGLGNKIYGIGASIAESIKSGKGPAPTIVLDVEGALVDISNLARDILIQFQSSPNLIAVGTISTVILGPVNSLISLILNTKAAVDDYNKSIRGINDRAQAARNADAFSNLVDARFKTAVARLVACNQNGPGGPGAPPAPGGTTVSTTPISNVISFDPNDKSGAAGIGNENFIAPGSLPYLIQFENDPDLGATVPAQEVYVTDTLDADLDVSTFEFTGFGFNQFKFDVPSGLTHYQDIIDLRPDGIELLVKVVLDVDLSSMELTASFQSLDPLTQIPPDGVDIGFLPVNDKQIGNGEGFLTYSVNPSHGLPTGTEIINTAEIVFDFNDPILTPTALNTIDAGTPTSSVTALPDAIGTSNFLVQWSGQDDAGGSGVANYDIYVSTNDGPFAPWILATTETSKEFANGVSGSSYGFFSVARDAVGNAESIPSSFDSRTLVIIGAWVNPTNLYDVNDQDGVTPLDALLIINQLARQVVFDPDTNILVPLPPDGYAPPYYDVTQDGRITPLDALRVINEIARNMNSSSQVNPEQAFITIAGLITNQVPSRAAAYFLDDSDITNTEFTISDTSTNPIDVEATERAIALLVELTEKDDTLASIDVKTKLLSDIALLECLESSSNLS